ncbi:MAG: SDR family oxidoreductase [Myxococcales bacterium]|nr:SDR family oxidoreductase [Myxococcales bacterium]
MTRSGVLVTGASGYLGSLAAAELLAHTDHHLLLPVRATHRAENVLARIGRELQATGGSQEVLARARVVALPALGSMRQLDRAVDESGVQQILHCAGCLDYFDEDALQRVNVGWTDELVCCAEAWGCRHFTYVSTAFASGYVDHPVPESLLPEPRRDPTAYTRSKRRAEHLVAGGGVPWLVVRPSIVIGDSRDGHYSGRRYGLVQLWSAYERLMTRAWAPELHAVARRWPFPVLHQDAFRVGLRAAWQQPPTSGVVNLVSKASTAPHLRTLWEHWVRTTLRPEVVTYYERLQDVPMRSIPRRQRALIALASVSFEIATHPWQFERDHLDAWCADGLDFPDATEESTLRCQRAYIAQSEALQAHMRRIADRPEEPLRVIEVVAPS